jgi:hypothetical protein
MTESSWNIGGFRVLSLNGSNSDPLWTGMTLIGVPRLSILKADLVRCLLGRSYYLKPGPGQEAPLSRAHMLKVEVGKRASARDKTC